MSLLVVCQPVGSGSKAYAAGMAGIVDLEPRLMQRPEGTHGCNADSALPYDPCSYTEWQMPAHKRGDVPPA